jgi:hypothetical protein
MRSHSAHHSTDDRRRLTLGLTSVADALYAASPFVLLTYFGPPQHFLYFFPLAHGHASFGFTFAPATFGCCFTLTESKRARGSEHGVRSTHTLRRAMLTSHVSHSASCVCVCVFALTFPRFLRTPFHRHAVRMHGPRHRAIVDSTC